MIKLSSQNYRFSGKQQINSKKLKIDLSSIKIVDSASLQPFYFVEAFFEFIFSILTAHQAKVKP